jgi:molybdopterin-guanine dinucleotide biosynthesis protein A
MRYIELKEKGVIAPLSLKTDPPHPDISGYILAGGKSLRMGSDKRLLQIGGVSLLEQTCTLLKSVLGSEPIIVGNSLPPEFSENHIIIPDFVPGKGPLAGLVSALKHCRTKWLALLPVDMPFLRAEELLKLFEYSASDYDVVAFSKEGFIEPLSAIYRTDKFDYWRARLCSGELSLYRGIMGLCWFALRSVSAKSLINFNRQEDLL